MDEASTAPGSPPWSASQLVAHNLTRARQLRGLAQAEVAERLSELTGARWTQVTVAQAEGSVSAERVRRFTANELVALARTFDLPLLYFFLPPEDGCGGLETHDSPAGGWAWEYLLLLVWGHRGNFPEVAERAAPWAHTSPLLVPGATGGKPDPDAQQLTALPRLRDRFTPEDILAVAFSGLARKGLLGPTGSGRELEVMADNLRTLARALEAFNAGRPGTYFDLDELRALVGRKARAQSPGSRRRRRR